MVNEGNKGRLIDDNCFVKPESSDHHHQLSSIQRGQADKNHPMEMEGRGFPDLYRNTSEELFIKSLMESSMGMPAPTMEMLGFKNLSQNFRTDSEELFKSWLTSGESSGYSSSMVHRTRQASRRISSELANTSSQQQGGTLQRKRSNDVFTQNTPLVDDVSTNLNQQSIRSAVERSMQASDFYLAKAWFRSSQPMTRSRSSELRKKYAAMQGSHTNLGMEAAENASGVGLSNLKQEFSNPDGFTDIPMHDIDNQFEAFMSPSHSSSSTFNAPQMGNVDRVSSVVDLLRGTLKRKKLGNQIEKETIEDSSNALCHAREIAGISGFDQGTGNNMHEVPGTFQEMCPSQLSNHAVLQTLQGSINLDPDNFGNPVNPIQLITVSQEPSQSESSAAAPVVSSAFDACDGPSNSNQTLSICESSRKQAGNRRNSGTGPGAKDFRERIIDNLRDEQKRGGLVMYGSETSAGSVDKVDPTKKRRVERSRKMAEAKERNLIPAVPSDMRAVLKRCDNLEKEVRSLKLNLSFMNRKDSEQTKQIEELQKQNEELADEKERLLEEIERILSETSKM